MLRGTCQSLVSLELSATSPRMVRPSIYPSFAVAGDWLWLIISGAALACVVLSPREPEAAEKRSKKAMDNWRCAVHRWAWVGRNVGLLAFSSLAGPKRSQRTVPSIHTVPPSSPFFCHTKVSHSERLVPGPPVRLLSVHVRPSVGSSTAGEGNGLLFMSIDYWYIHTNHRRGLRLKPRYHARVFPGGCTTVRLCRRAEPNARHSSRTGEDRLMNHGCFINNLPTPLPLRVPATFPAGHVARLSSVLVRNRLQSLVDFVFRQGAELGIRALLTVCSRSSNNAHLQLPLLEVDRQHRAQSGDA